MSAVQLKKNFSTNTGTQLMPTLGGGNIMLKKWTDLKATGLVFSLFRFKEIDGFKTKQANKQPHERASFPS